MSKPVWFRIPYGNHVGELHLEGWMLAAIRGEPLGRNDDGWLAYGICPRCYAMVVADDRNSYGDQTWNHEQWHADTDYPAPDTSWVKTENR